jgi:5-methylcytosine-specific restriction endonuclease McrA
MTARDIPAHLRSEVYGRDNGTCRMCGRGGIPTQIHHIIYGGDARGMGGRRIHNVDEMVTLDASCHELAHSDKGKWQPLLLLAIQKPGLTAFQLQRWRAAITKESV